MESSGRGSLPSVVVREQGAQTIMNARQRCSMDVLEASGGGPLDGILQCEDEGAPRPGTRTLRGRNPNLVAAHDLLA